METSISKLEVNIVSSFPKFLSLYSKRWPKTRWQMMLAMTLLRMRCGPNGLPRNDNITLKKKSCNNNTCEVYFSLSETSHFVCIVYIIYHQNSGFLWHSFQIRPEWQAPVTSSQIQNIWGLTERNVSAASIRALLLKRHLMDNKDNEGNFLRILNVC